MKLLEQIRGFFSQREADKTANIEQTDKTSKRSYTPTYWGDSLNGLANLGLGVSNETSMKIAAVYRCIDILSSTIAALPFEYKRKKNGVFTVEESDLTNYVLNVKSNSYMNAYDVIRNSVIQMVVNGNAFLMPKWNTNAELDSLILLSPNSTTYDRMTNLYHVSDLYNGIVGTYDSDDIIHLKNMSLDGGYTGVSTIRYAAHVLGIAASADAKSYESFQPGSGRMGFVSGNPTAGVKGFGDFQDAQIKTVSDRIEEEIKSKKQIFFLPEGMNFNALSLSPNDIQLLESKKLSVLDICRFFGVHPDKVFAGQSQNYKASEMSQIQFYSDTLLPRLRQIETEFTAKLVSKRVWSKYKVEFDLNLLYSTDLQSEAAYMRETIQNGVITVNEWRRRKGQQPVDGGDIALVSTNTRSVSSTETATAVNANV